jgi:hypothetical protein
MAYLVIRMHKEDNVLPRSKRHPTCLTSSSGCTKKTLFCSVLHVILRVLPHHPDSQRRRCFAAFQMSFYVFYLVIRMRKKRLCFAAFQMSSYVSYLVILMRKEDVVLLCSKCHPTCLTSSSGCTKKTLFCRIPNVILRVLPSHPDAKRRCFAAVQMSSYVSYLVIGIHKEDNVCCVLNVILRVLPRHPDSQRRRCFAAFQMSFYVSYLVIRMRKEMFCRGPNVILRVFPRHPNAQRRRCFAVFQMSSYVSYLVIRMHKEDDALPRCFPFDLF